MLKNTKLENVIAVISCLLVNLISGTIYMYSAFGPQMVKILGYSDADSSLVTSLATYGLNLPGPIVGTITDRVGPRVSSMIATLFVTLGYLLMMLSFQGAFGDISGNVALVAFFYTLVGFGSSFGYNAGVSTIVKNAPPEKVGAFSGLGVGFFALSAFILTNVKKGLFPHITDLAHFFTFMTLYCFILGLLAFPGIKVTRINPPSSKQKEEQNQKRKIPSEDSLQNIHTVEVNELSADDLGHHSIENIEHEEEIEKESKKLLPGSITAPEAHKIAPNDIRGWNYLSHPRFWYLLYNVFIITGAGYMYVMKVGTIVTSLCGGDSSATMVAVHTAILPVFNFIGRLSSGAITDLAKRKFGMSRVYFIGVASLLMATGQALVLSVEDPNALIYSTMIIGYTYGFTFATIPSLISDWFTRSQYGFKWGMILYGTAFGNQMFSSIFSSYYDEYPSPCKGLQCHSQSFQIACGLTCVSSLFAFVMGYFLSRRDAVLSSSV